MITLDPTIVTALALALLRHDDHTAGRLAGIVCDYDIPRVQVLIWIIFDWNDAGVAQHGIDAWRHKLITAIVDAYLPAP